MNRFKLARKSVFVFFLIGTILLLIHLTFSSFDAIIGIGYVYVIASVYVNIVIVLILVVTFFIEKNKIETLKSIGITILNLPIAYFYLLIVIGSI